MLLLPAFTGAPEVNKVYNCDALTLLRALADKSVDAIITDLPYGTTACSWDVIIPFEPMWREVRRVLKHNGAFVTTASQPFTSLLIGSNLKWFRHEWIVEKSTPTGHLNTNKAPLKAHDNVLVFSAGEANYYPQFTKGKPYRATSGAAGGYVADKSTAGHTTVNEGVRFPRSVLRFSYEHGLHPTQKSVDLFEYLIRTYSQPNDLILDFCCGSGTSPVAARKLERRFIACDTTLKYVEITRKRVTEAYTPDMFVTYGVGQGSFEASLS